MRRRRAWLDAEEFEDAIATSNLLPGPASTQLAIFCAWRLRGGCGALVGGLAFILPGPRRDPRARRAFLGAPPRVDRGAGAGAGAAVAAVAVHAGAGLLPASWGRAAAARVRAGSPTSLAVGRRRGAGRRLGRPGPARVRRWSSWSLRRHAARASLGTHAWPRRAAAASATGGAARAAWTALKVGALSYGGGFVIIPLMQADAVDRYHWMTDPQFLNAVALGQVTPGPVVHTVAVVGYAARGIGGGAARRRRRLRCRRSSSSSLGCPPLRSRCARNAGVAHSSTAPARRRSERSSARRSRWRWRSTEPWQAAVLAAAAVALLVARRGVVPTLLAAGALGALVGLLGAGAPGEECSGTLRNPIPYFSDQLYATLPLRFKH